MPPARRAAPRGAPAGASPATEAESEALAMPLDTSRKPLAERLVLYYQLTLGAPHLARIRALDAVPGVACLGVQLASAEQSRAFELRAEDAALCSTVIDGTYEELPLGERLAAARRHLDALEPDAIIIDCPADLVQFRLAKYAQSRGIAATTRWAATWADHPRTAWKERLKRVVYRGWDAYLNTGQRGRDYLRSFGVPESLIFDCGNPVDCDPIERRAAELASHEREDSFLFVGRFLDLKNLERFTRAFRRYRDEGGGWRLRLVGFGDREAAVRAEAQGCEAIELAGHRQFDELIELYARCGALVLPSYSENWGLVVNEAMHAGAPVLLTRCVGCVPELLEEGRNGFAMDERDEGSMVAALHRFEALSKAERAAMSRRSRSIIASHRPEHWAAAAAKAIETAIGYRRSRNRWLAGMAGRLAG